MPSPCRVFRTFPHEIFRVNKGPLVRLREWSPHRPLVWDITLSPTGIALPKALDPATYNAPNGASMRPNGYYQQRLVKQLRGDDGVIYAVPRGTVVPEELLLVHEHLDHYSLQAGREMTLFELNRAINEFLQGHGRVMSKERWLEVYGDR